MEAANAVKSRDTNRAHLPSTVPLHESLWLEYSYWGGRWDVEILEYISTCEG